MNTKVCEQKRYVFSQPHPHSSLKARALSWSWNGNKQPPGEVPSERSQQQQTWQATACQQFSHTRERISSLSAHQLLLSFEAEYLPPWDAEGHKRLSCPLIGFSRNHAQTFPHHLLQPISLHQIPITLRDHQTKITHCVNAQWGAQKLKYFHLSSAWMTRLLSSHLFSLANIWVQCLVFLHAEQ